MLQIAEFPVTYPSVAALSDTHSPEPNKLVATPPLVNCEICVVIPVRNEAANIVAALQALTHQLDLQGQPFAYNCYEVIVLANNCTDDTAAIARLWAAQHPRLQLHIVEITLAAVDAHVGRARRILMDEAHRRLMWLERPRGIIATTDGDTVVAPDWLAATWAEIANGADGVGGRITINRAEREAFQARRLYLRDNGYHFLVAEIEHFYEAHPYDCWPRHHQHFGASFALTTQMYQRVGGLPPLRALEDVALYRAIMREDGSFRHSPAVRVTTSGRQYGRTEYGLAPQLRYWLELEAGRQACLVESAAAIEMRLQCRQSLRQLWQQERIGQPIKSSQIAVLAEDLGIEADWLAAALVQSQPFGMLYEQMEMRQQAKGVWAGRWPQADLAQVIAELRLRLETIRRQRAFSLRRTQTARRGQQQITSCQLKPDILNDVSRK